MEKRVQIIDFNHMVYNYAYGGARLSKNMIVNGESVVVDTSIQSGTIKSIYRWSMGGVNPTAVCFDNPCPGRKEYFRELYAEEGGTTEGGYKGGRSRMPNQMFEAIDMTTKLLVQGGVSCYRGMGYEADDLVRACIEVAKKKYPGMKIDVVTNDTDLVPLVDDTVSVFLRSKKGTWAESKGLEKNHYIQVTPQNYSEVLEGLSAFKGLTIPYNMLLFVKIVRGDSADNLPGWKRAFPPRRVNQLLSGEEGGFKPEDMAHGFLYGDFEEEMGYWVPRMEEVGMTQEEIEFIVGTYVGMNLNESFRLKNGSLDRVPAKVSAMKPFNEIELQKSVSVLDIHLLR